MSSWDGRHCVLKDRTSVLFHTISIACDGVSFLTIICTITSKMTRVLNNLCVEYTRRQVIRSLQPNPDFHLRLANEGYISIRAQGTQNFDQTVKR